MDVMEGYIGVKQDVFLRLALIFLDTPIIYIAVVGFSVLLVLVLAFIYAWQYTARNGGKLP